MIDSTIGGSLRTATRTKGLVVVHYGSTDGTWRRLIELKAQHPRLHLVDIAGPLDERVAMFEGARRAEGDLVSFVPADADDDEVKAALRRARRREVITHELEQKLLLEPPAGRVHVQAFAPGELMHVHEQAPEEASTAVMRDVRTRRGRVAFAVAGTLAFALGITAYATTGQGDDGVRRVATARIATPVRATAATLATGDHAGIDIRQTDGSLLVATSDENLQRPQGKAAHAIAPRTHVELVSSSELAALGSDAAASGADQPSATGGGSTPAASAGAGAGDATPAAVGSAEGPQPSTSASGGESNEGLLPTPGGEASSSDDTTAPAADGWSPPGNEQGDQTADPGSTPPDEAAAAQPATTEPPPTESPAPTEPPPPTESPAIAPGNGHGNGNAYGHANGHGNGNANGHNKDATS